MSESPFTFPEARHAAHVASQRQIAGEDTRRQAAVDLADAERAFRKDWPCEWLSYTRKALLGQPLVILLVVMRLSLTCVTGAMWQRVCSTLPRVRVSDCKQTGECLNNLFVGQCNAN